MSGPAIHHIVAKETIRKMKVGATGDHLAFLEKVETEWSSYLYFGCQGPDPLFFNIKDIDSNLRDVVKIYLDAMEFIEDFKEQIMEIIPPEVIEAAEKLQEVWNDIEERSVLLSEIEQSLTEAKNLLAILSDTLIAAVKKYITDAVNVFNVLLSNPIQDIGEYEPGQWWWFDTLHYRKTGEYAEQLLKNARPNSEQMAYAIGYLTHFSSDVVGHPFVNILSGGPYRTHAQRHKFVENHQDVYAWKNFFKGEEFIQSKVGEQYIINGDDDTLPEEFNEFIRKSINDVYGSLNYGVNMDSEDLDDTYQLWLRWFRSTTNTLDLPKPVPYSLTKEMQEAWDKFVENMGDALDGITSPGKGAGSIWDFFKSLAAAILGGIAAAIALIDFVLGVLATLGAAPIRYFISVAYEYLYNSFQQFHQGLVLNGLAFPFNKQLDHFSARHTVHTAIPDTTGLKAVQLRGFYPFKKFEFGPAINESHLVYPRTDTNSTEDKNIEQSLSNAAPEQYYNDDPFLYINGNLNLNREFYEFAKGFTELTGSFDKNQNFNTLSQHSSTSGFGNAVDFGNFLFTEFTNGNGIPDFNLDGDRGYGFPCWRRVMEDADFDNKNVMHVAVEADPDTNKHNVLNIQTDIIHPNIDIL